MRNGVRWLALALLLVAGEASQVALVETFHGPAGAAYFTNAVSEIVAGPSAVVSASVRTARTAYQYVRSFSAAGSTNVVAPGSVRATGVGSSSAPAARRTS